MHCPRQGIEHWEISLKVALGFEQCSEKLGVVSGLPFFPTLSTILLPRGRGTCSSSSSSSSSCCKQRQLLAIPLVEGGRERRCLSLLPVATVRWIGLREKESLT